MIHINTHLINGKWVSEVSKKIYNSIKRVGFAKLMEIFSVLIQLNGQISALTLYFKRETSNIGNIFI